MWQRVKHLFIWLGRMRHSGGFGIQSPTDYWFVRYVVNEHWPYYAYKAVGQGDDWLTARLGRLYMRLANWRQPVTIVTDALESYFNAGCRRAKIVRKDDGMVQLVRISVENDAETVLQRTDDRSLLIVEGIWRDKRRWRRLVDDPRTVITFDLYYCGLVMFDRKRTKQHYVINF